MCCVMFSLSFVCACGTNIHTISCVTLLIHVRNSEYNYWLTSPSILFKIQYLGYVRGGWGRSWVKTCQHHQQSNSYYNYHNTVPKKIKFYYFIVVIIIFTFHQESPLFVHHGYCCSYSSSCFHPFSGHSEGLDLDHLASPLMEHIVEKYPL